MSRRLALLLILLLGMGLVSACSSSPKTAPLLPEEPLVRALVMQEVPELAITLQHPAHLHAEGSSSRLALPAGSTLIVAHRGNELVARDPRQGTLASATSLQLRPDSPSGTYTLRNNVTGEPPRQDPHYEGLLDLRPSAGNTLNAIVVLPVEEYLRGVVPSEIGTTSPFEAMKAQAVAARSETITALTERTYAGPHYDICSDVNCQVFRGTFRRTEQTDAAIRETRGIILTHDGRPIPAYYSSNAGGHTENILNVWPGRDRGIPVWEGVYDGDPADRPGDLRVEANARAWILSRPNVYVNAAHHPGLPSWTHGNFRWEVTHTAEDLSAAVARTRDIGRVLRIETGERGPSARLVSVTFVGERGELRVGPELAVRRTFQPALRSSAIVVEPVGDPARPEAFRIRGAGFGHGVGLCQTGAMGRALEGQDYARILLHYYVGTELTRAYE